MKSFWITVDEFRSPQSGFYLLTPDWQFRQLSTALK